MADSKKTLPQESSPRTARDIAQNPSTKPRAMPISYRQRLGLKAPVARVPWESPPIETQQRGREAPPQGRDVTYAEAVGTVFGAAEASGVGEAMSLGVGQAGAQSQIQLEGVAGEAVDATESTDNSAPLPRFRAQQAIVSPSWTGGRPLREQVTVIESLAPFARASVDQLITALEEQRLNDPAAQDALEALKELHGIIGELIELASSKRPMNRVWKRFERAKQKLTDALWNGAQVILVAPTLAIGAATFLSMLSGFPINEGMVTALCAASMTKDALLTVAKRR